VAGYTESNNFPVLDAGTYFQGVFPGQSDAFILKFNNAGAWLWATYYGGSGGDVGNSITCDNTGNVFVTGNTTSTNFTVQPLAGAYNQTVNAGGSLGDAFILKFTNTGSYDNWKQSIFQQATIQNIGADKYNQLKIAIISETDFKNMIDG
jgi:hypothetical protein